MEVPHLYIVHLCPGLQVASFLSLLDTGQSDESKQKYARHASSREICVLFAGNFLASTTDCARFFVVKIHLISDILHYLVTGKE